VAATNRISPPKKKERPYQSVDFSLLLLHRSKALFFSEEKEIFLLFMATALFRIITFCVL